MHGTPGLQKVTADDLQDLSRFWTALHRALRGQGRQLVGPQERDAAPFRTPVVMVAGTTHH